MKLQQTGFAPTPLVTCLALILAALIPTIASAQCSPITLDSSSGLVTVELFYVVNDVESPIPLTQQEVDELFDGDLVTGKNFGRFIEFRVRVTLETPNPGETFEISEFRIIESTECDPVTYPATGAYSDLNDQEQPINVNTTFALPISTLELDIPGGSPLGMNSGGYLQVTSDYLTCEPEGTIVEIEIVGELCEESTAADERSWSQVKSLYRD